MRRTSAVIVLALVVALAAPTSAQITTPSGTVKYVDVVTNTIHFTDGRIVHMKPGTQIMLDGSVVKFDQVRPGMTVVLKEAPPAASAATADPAPTSQVITTHPPIDASGEVASVDRETRQITFKDGRVLELTTDQRVWQAVDLDRVQPGQQVWVNAARPVAFRSGATRMGTVARVDQARQVVVLSDGSIVRLRPGGAVTLGADRLRIIDLQPGDEIVVRLDPGTTASAQSPTTDNASHLASASPRTDSFARATSIEASEILIVRRHQAP